MIIYIAFALIFGYFIGKMIEVLHGSYTTIRRIDRKQEIRNVVRGMILEGELNEPRRKNKRKAKTK